MENFAVKTPREYVKHTAQKYGVNVQELLSHGRSREMVAIRDEIAYFLRFSAKLSYPRIGYVLGERDHTTAIAMVKRHKILLNAGTVVARANSR